MGIKKDRIVTIEVSLSFSDYCMLQNQIKKIRLIDDCKISMNEYISNCISASDALLEHQRSLHDGLSAYADSYDYIHGV